MRTEQLLHKLQLQAAAESEREWRQRRYQAAHPTVTAQAIQDQKISQIANLRKETAEAKFQLELDRQLEAETRKNLAATMKLRESRLTAAERKARAEETSRGRKRKARSPLLPVAINPCRRPNKNPQFRRAPGRIFGSPRNAGLQPGRSELFSVGFTDCGKSGTDCGSCL